MQFDLDPYSILGLPASASPDDIKNAYRRIARRLHPDSNPNNPGASNQFKDVTVAYELLMDPTQRAAYDNRRGKGEDIFYFTLRTTPSKRTLSVLNEPQVIYLLTEIFPDPRAADSQQKHETNLNLTLVLDRSNSMNGVRMDKVKTAAHQIIDSLTPKDIISIVSFNDRADIIVPATPVKDKPALKARVSMMSASGGTEIFRGLSAGVEQNRTYLGPKLVNHVILLTDGQTYGDHEACLDLATQASKDGIGISAMGLGNDWNDEFLDQLAGRTGGSSSYISSASAVTRFLNDHVRHLSNAFADRVRLSVAPDPDVEVELAFKLAPNPQPLELENGELQLGSLQATRPIAVLLQLQMPAQMAVGFRSIARLVAFGDILSNKNQRYLSVNDLNLEVTANPGVEEPPTAILDALSKLTLYRLQERAQEALERGDVTEATRRLENLATRLLAMGEEELANQTLSEARRVAHTAGLSDKGRKTIKYQTRFLLAGPNTNGNE